MLRRILIIVLVIGLGFAGAHCKGKGIAAVKKPQGPYHAIALTTGTLFFAHLKKEDDRYLYLSDVHYFQRSGPDVADRKGGSEKPNLTLVSQSNDIYAPKDELKLNRAHLLYYQELKEDSPVLKSILQK